LTERLSELRRAKSRKFRSLGEALPGLLRRWNLEGVLRDQQVTAVWSAVVGEKIAEHTRPVSVEAGLIMVEVDSPGWAMQLTYLKPEIIKKLQRRVGKESVTDVRFVLSSRRGFRL
jgi:predicted nucleic acid-binding Zn ribbon protein